MEGTLASLQLPRAGLRGGGGKAEEDTSAPSEAYHTATATIFMTDSLRHWQKLTRGVPLSPMRPSMMPAGAGTHEHVTEAARGGAGEHHALRGSRDRPACTCGPRALADSPAASDAQCFPVPARLLLLGLYHWTRALLLLSNP